MLSRSVGRAISSAAAKRLIEKLVVVEERVKLLRYLFALWKKNHGTEALETLPRPFAFVILFRHYFNMRTL